MCRPTRRLRRGAAIAIVAGLATAAAGCGSETPDQSSPPSTSTVTTPSTAPPTTAGTTVAVPDVPGQVTIVDYELLPGTITIATGATVTWQNEDDVDHWMLTEDGTTVDSGAITPGQPYVATLTTPGTYPYYCEIHNAMQGTIVVE